VEQDDFERRRVLALLFVGGGELVGQLDDGGVGAEGDCRRDDGNLFVELLQIFEKKGPSAAGH
jgi:hypothetical protein